MFGPNLSESMSLKYFNESNNHLDNGFVLISESISISEPFCTTIDLGNVKT